MPTPSTTPSSSKQDLANARKKRLRRILRRTAYLALGLLAIAAIVFLLLPVWISNEQGRTYVLQQLNKNMPAKIAIEDWSLGWFHGTELKNVTVTLPDGTRLFAAPKIQSELTLWGIFSGHYDIGITKIDTAQVAITRYANHSTSLDALFPPPSHAATHAAPADFPPAKIFRTLRGSLQVGSAIVTLNSQATAKSLTYTDVKAALTVASPDAPFHVQISAVGPGASPASAGLSELSLSLNATLPPPSTWPAAPWNAIADIDLSATNLPTALVCDYINIDPRWEDSIGPVVERLRFVNHVTPPLETSLPTLELKGTNGAYVDAAMLLRAAGGPATAATLSLPAVSSPTENFHADAALRVSAPLTKLLAHINPILGAIDSGDGLITCRVAELNVTSGNLENIQASAKLTFPPLQLQRKGFLATLLQAAGDEQSSHPPTQFPTPTLPAAADTLRLKIAGGAIACDNFTVICNRNQRITFTGSAQLAGTLNFLATVPTPSAETLTSSRTEIPITGTTDNPIVNLPH